MVSEAIGRWVWFAVMNGETSRVKFGRKKAGGTKATRHVVGLNPFFFRSESHRPTVTRPGPSSVVLIPFSSGQNPIHPGTVRLVPPGAVLIPFSSGQNPIDIVAGFWRCVRLNPFFFRSESHPVDR